MWRVAAKETKENKTCEALRGATGSGNVSIGQVGAGTTTLNGTTSVTTLNATSATSGMNIGINLTSADINVAGSATRTGNIYIGTLGSGPLTIGNSTATLALRGSSTTFTSPLTLGSAPTTSGQLGFVTTLVNNVTLTCNSGATVNTSAVFLPAEAGTYVVNGNFTWASGTPDLISISTTNASINVFCTGTLPIGKYLNLNTIISVGASASIYIVSNAATGTYVGHLKCARIG